MSLAHKQQVRALGLGFSEPGPAQDAAVRAAFAPDAAFHIVHPWNDLAGVDAYIGDFLDPLRAAFSGLYRRDDILIGGHFEGADWVSCTGNYVGKFAAPLLNIQPTGALEYLRFGEFHRIVDGLIVETHVFLDLSQLMIAAGQWPLATSPGVARGYTGFIPGPGTQDGLQLHENAQDRTDSTATMVTKMLRGLATPDEAWRPFWHDNMVWYGPGAFGSFIGIEDFSGFQVPFEGAFSHWSGGASGNGVTRHFTRYADGDYACIGGWPSLMAVRKDAFLGHPGNGETIYMRVCDWWRRDGNKLIENWVFVDIPDVLLQMGQDLFPKFHDVAPGARKAPA